MDSILHVLGLLSTDNRRWLAEHLMEQVKKEEDIKNMSDEDFMRKLFSTPYHNPMSAEEENKMIRDSHYFAPDRAVTNLQYGK